MSTRLIVCDTCKRPENEIDLSGKTCGEGLAELIEAGADGVTVERHSCLMGCERACNIAISAPGKLTYVLGQFEPSQDSAEAILDYARLYEASETGQVPYRSWPEGIKGHFVARIPAADV